MDFPEYTNYKPNQKEADCDANIDNDVLLDAFLGIEFSSSLDDSISIIRLGLIKSLSILRAKACHRET